LVMVAQIDPSLRVRFSTSHPKDIDESLIRAIAKYPNICKHVHLPIQSGSNAVLKRMGRKYTREGYLKKANLIKELIPECSLSTDIIAGFSGETEQDHQETLSAIREVGYYTAFMFQYSERPDTLAAKKYPDNVLTDVKNRRLSEIIALQQEFSHTSNKADLGKTFEVLVEGASKRSSKELFGRTSQNKVCIFPAGKHKVGDYVNVKVVSCSSATLKGVVIG
ncbi:MAG: radical SAM protein, partial [Bacteroidales bacterium]